MKKIISVLLSVLLFILNVYFKISAEENTTYSQEVYIKEDFEVKNGYNSRNHKTEVIKEKTDNNTYLKFLGSSAGSRYADFNLGKTQSNIVLEYDVMITSAELSGMLLYVWDQTTSLSGTKAKDSIVLLNSGGIIAPKNGTPYTMTLKEWTHVEFDFNLKQRTYSAYVEGTLLCTNAYYSSSAINSIDGFRVYLNSLQSGSGSLMIDNLKVYNGTQSRDISNETAIGYRYSVFKSEYYIKKFLNNKTALQSESGILFINDEKEPLTNDAFDESGEVYVSITDFERLMQVKLTDCGDYFQAGGARFYINSYKASKNSVDINLNNTLLTKNSITYFPLLSAANILEKYVYTDNCGTFVISENECSISDSDFKELSMYLFFNRQTAADYRRILGSKGISHPYVLINKNRIDYLKSAKNTDTTLKSWYNTLIKEADNTLVNSNPVYNKPNGTLLSVCNSVELKVMNLALAWQMTGDTRYARKACETIEAVCQFQDWNAAGHFLDVGVMSFSVGLFYDWCYDYLDIYKPNFKDTVYNAAKNFALERARRVYYGIPDEDNSSVKLDTFFTKTETNWNGVCNGGIAVLAMALMDCDTYYLSDVLEGATRALEYGVYETGPDGCWNEGVSYWEFYLKYLSRFMSTYDNLIGEGYNYADFKGMDKFGYVGANLSSPEGNMNFHDSSDNNRAPGALFYLSDKYNDQRLASLKLQFTYSYDIKPDFESFCLYKPYVEDENLDNSAYYRKVEAVMVKENPNNADAMTFMAHGGNTQGAHNHYDGGAFVYDVLGERWATDLGKEDYDLVSADIRNNFYRIRTEGHNTLTINPSSYPGQSSTGFSKFTTFKVGRSKAYAVLDMSSLYEFYGANSVIRGFFVDDNRRSLTIRDEIDFASSQDTYWFMHTDAIVTQNGNSFTLTKNGKSVTLSYVTDATVLSANVMSAAPLETTPAVIEQTSNDGISKIAIKIHGTGKKYIEVKLIPNGENISSVPKNVAISDWKIENETEQFNSGNVFGLFGRDENDNSLYEDSLEYQTKIDRNPDGISQKLSFYAAFSKDGGKYIGLKGKKNMSGINESLGNLIELKDTGELKVFNQTVKSRFHLVSDKWYKIDALIKTGNSNTVTIYLDNTRIADNVDFLSGDSIQEISAICMDKGYLDDFISTEAQTLTKTELTFGSAQWKYQRYYVVNNGFISYGDRLSDYTTSLGFIKSGISSIVLKEKQDTFKKKYFVLTTSDADKLYMPIFDFGELIYSGKAKILDLSDNGMGTMPVTLKFTVNKESGKAFEIVINNSITAFSSNDGINVTAGGKNSELTEAANELAISLYPGKRYCDIYINGKAISEKFSLGTASYPELNGFEVTGSANLEKVLCHTGGYFNDKHFSDFYSDGNTVGIYAQSLVTTDAALVLGYYNNGILNRFFSKEITIDTSEKPFCAESDEANEVKAMLFDSLKNMRPLVKSFSKNHNN